MLEAETQHQLLVLQLEPVVEAVEDGREKGELELHRP